MERSEPEIVNEPDVASSDHAHRANAGLTASPLFELAVPASSNAVIVAGPRRLLPPMMLSAPAKWGQAR